MNEAHFAILASGLVFLTQLGVIGWFKWSVERIAEMAAQKAEERVLAELKFHSHDKMAHPEGSEYRIGPLVESLKALSEVVSRLDKKMDALLVEHKLLSGTCTGADVLKRIAAQEHR